MALLGLTLSDVNELRKKFGYNEIPSGNETTALTILLRQFKNVMVYILLVVIALSIFLGKTLHAIVVVIILAIVVLLGFINEYRANKEMKALRKLIVPKCVVIREGKKEVISSKELVPGDIVYLSTGDIVPADGIVIDAKDLKVTEATITGESEPVLKKPFPIEHLNEDAINSPELFLEYIDQTSEENKVYMSTFVVEGHGYVKVIYTGKNTEFGKIAHLMKQQKKEQINIVEKPLEGFTLFAIFMVVLTFFLFFFRSAPALESVKEFFATGLFFEGLTIALAMLVSGIPEGLPVVVTVALALGVKEMSKKNALVNRMDSLEALGKVSFICTDKTGTLTKNELTVQKFFFNNKMYNVSGIGYNTLGEVTRGNHKVNADELRLFVDALVLCNNSELKDITEKTSYNSKNLFFEVIGSTTEGSLLVLGEKLNVNKVDLDLKYPKIEEIPFSSERKYMASLHNYPFSLILHGKVVDSLHSNIKQNHLEKTLFVKGAPEIILKKCTKRIHDNHIVPLTKSYKETIEQMIHKLSSSGYRVLAVAAKKLDKDEPFDENVANDLIFLGFVALKDAPREDVKESIEIARKAGIKVMMITGDHKKTAEAIAKDVGLIKDTDSDYLVLTGPELDSLTDEQLEFVVENIKICARARPEHKLRIIQALKKKDHIIAMTGDGVNDAPALKKADVGIAIGSGTEVAKDASDIILKDDSFSTIVHAIKEGRKIFENLQKFTSYQFACNIAELMIIFLSVLFSLPTALTSLQILFMNLVTDDFPAIALASNRASKDIMSWKPKKDEGLFNKRLKALTILAGLIMTVLVFGLYFYTFVLNNQDLLFSRGTALFLLILLELLFAISFRSFRKFFLKINLKENRFLMVTIIISLVLTILLYVTPLSRLFEITLFGLREFLIILVMSAIGVLALDISKLKIMKHYYFN